nr:uncharacterized protein LOC102549583 isoform X4 [Rattus norvegicus]
MVAHLPRCCQLGISFKNWSLLQEIACFLSDSQLLPPIFSCYAFTSLHPVPIQHHLVPEEELKVCPPAACEPGVGTERHGHSAGFQFLSNAGFPLTYLDTQIQCDAGRETSSTGTELSKKQAKKENKRWIKELQLITEERNDLRDCLMFVTERSMKNRGDSEPDPS